MACLDRHLEGVRLLGEILERGTPGVVENATRTALALSPLSDCTGERIAGTAGAKDEEGLRKAHPEIAEKIERARLLGRSGAFVESDGLASEARDEAQRASLSSLEAAALVKLGRNKIGLQNWQESAQLDFDAFEAAERSGATATAAEAAVDIAFSETKLNKTDDVQHWLRVASALLERMGGDRRLEVNVAQVRADALRSSGNYKEAVEESRKALVIAESPSETDPVLFAAVLNTYGLALALMDDSAGGDEAYERALEIFERELGPDHPTTGIILSNLALGKLHEERYEEALGFGRRALSISEKLGPEYPSQSKDRAAVGRALTGLRRYEEARPYLERALALAEQNPTAERRELAYRYVSIGQLEDRTNHDAEAERAYERAIVLFDGALGKGRPEAADATLGLGLLRLKEGRPRDALDALEIALAESDRGGDVAPVTRLALARALWETGGDRVRARALAQQAEDRFAQHAAGEAGARDLEQWLRAHGVLVSR
jgi:tetratricopeptide (TPR) repeat protein